MIIDKMLNNYYKILAFMYENVVIVGDENLIPLTQNEISGIMDINRVSINKAFKEYMSDELIYRKNSRYYFTDKGIRIIKKIKSIRE